MAELRLSEEAVANLVQKAILDSLNQEARDKLVSDAIAALLMPEKDTLGYGSKKSLLELAFERSVGQAAYQIVSEEIVSNEDVRKKIRELVHPVVASIIAGDDSRLQDAIGQAVGSVITDRLRYND